MVYTPKVNNRVSLGDFPAIFYIPLTTLLQPFYKSFAVRQVSSRPDCLDSSCAAVSALLGTLVAIVEQVPAM